MIQIESNCTIDDVGLSVAILSENEVDTVGGVVKDFVFVGLEVFNDDLLDAHEMLGRRNRRYVLNLNYCNLRFLRFFGVFNELYQVEI